MATAAKLPDQEPQRVSLDRYLHCSDWEPDAEYVDGEIEERPVGENDHSAWQEAICAWFRQHAREWNVRVRPEQRVQVSATRFRVPDVAILDRALPIEQIVTRPPIAVFEVLSPEDRQSRMLRKLNDYAAMGISQIWVIDPDGPRVQRFLDGLLLPATTFEEPARKMRFEMTEVQALVD